MLTLMMLINWSFFKNKLSVIRIENIAAENQLRGPFIAKGERWS